LKIAAIDIGSNSIKLAVVEAATSDSFAVLAREKETVRLGHETLTRERLSAAAVERAVDCVRRFRSIAEARGAEHVVCAATASVREARNARAFVREVERQTGVRVQVLPGVEEARLIGLAASRGCGAPDSSLMNIDIGGGSTEITLMRNGAPARLYSVRLGAVRLTDQFVKSDPVSPKALRAMRDEIQSLLERPERELGRLGWRQTTGTSGTILAVGGALRRLRDVAGNGQPAAPAGDGIAFGELVRFNERMAGMKFEERRAVRGVSAQRAEIVVAGGQILEGVMRALRVNFVRTCDWSLREGLIIDRLRGMEADALPPAPDIGDQRLLGAHAVGRRFGYEEAHARRITQFAEQIFDCLAEAHDLTRHERTMLSAAALLHDVGYHIAHDSHHKHTLYLIRSSELTNFSESERDVIANVARYHCGALPKRRHRDFAALGEQDQLTVRRLGAILRVADALDRSHDGRVEAISCARDGDKLRVEMRSALPCDREVLAARQKSDLFGRVFGLRLALSAKQKGAPPQSAPRARAARKRL
jgi:exopolyphosphatase/guanosine-5'-triphosphate,3'-diphosphate pyrophosphatase